MNIPFGGFKPGELVILASTSGYKSGKNAGYLCGVIDGTIKQFPDLSSEDVIAVIQSYIETMAENLPVMTNENIMQVMKPYLESGAFLDAIQVKISEKTAQSTPGVL